MAPDCRARLEDRLWREWQRQGPAQLMLRPLSWLYRAGLAFRSSHAVWTPPVPTIVIGNVAVGGAGKTPLAMAVVETLQRAGYRPGVVSRGYGSAAGESGDAIAVSDSSLPAGMSGARWWGDEPWLMRKRLSVPIVIGKKRVQAVKALITGFSEVDVVVCDDGLQHRALGRDIEIAVIDGERGIGNAHLLPAGPLREPATRLNTVDAIVVNGGHYVPQAAAPVFRMALEHEQFVNAKDGRTLAPDAFARLHAGRRIAAVAGIGNPERFQAHLARLHIDAALHAFADHHVFSRDHIERVDADIIVMTEKDAVKCSDFAHERMWFMRVDAVLPREFETFLLKRLSDVHRPQTA